MTKTLLLFALCFSLPALAQPIRSDLRAVTGVKFPNQEKEGLNPIMISVQALRSDAPAQGFTELLPFVLRAPDQEEAGSCLYMSLTGNAEWWVARLNPRLDRSPDGPADLSERHLMLEAGLFEEENGVKNWKTDSAYLFNQMKTGMALNRDFRFTKGWHISDSEERYQAATPTTPGAEYGPEYNWVREAIPNSARVKLPKFRREVLFADPASDQWNTGVMPANIAETIKAALVKNKAPVHVIYNHYGYWHANLIVGFDDARDNSNCAFVNGYIKHTADRVIEIKKEMQALPPGERDSLKGALRKAEVAAQKIKTAYARGGGCRPKGVFYVRDSIYPDPEGPIYDYDLRNTGEETHYSKTTVLLEYDWIRYMGNHAVQVLVD